MKLLVDNQLPKQLAHHLRGWGLDCVHVLEIGLNESNDIQVWDRHKGRTYRGQQG